MKSKLYNMHGIAAPVVAALALVAFTAQADVEDKINRSFKVQPGGQLVVEVDRGSIEVKTTAAEETVGVEVSRTARGSDTKARKVLEDHVVTASQEGDKVEVRAEFKGTKASSWFGRSPDLQVRYVITIPRRFDVNLQTAGGNIKVADLMGKAQIRTAGGSLTLEKIEGPVVGHTSGGSIHVTGCRATVDVHTSGGGVNLSEIEGDVTARTSGGSIRVERLAGKATVRTSGGGIDIAAIKGSIDASTSGGSIKADIAEQPVGACTFKTSGGGITVELDGKVAADVDLRTSGGRVSTDFPVVTVVQGEQTKNELRGKVNGGGPLITAHTSGGSVRLQKR